MSEIVSQKPNGDIVDIMLEIDNLLDVLKAEEDISFLLGWDEGCAENDGSDESDGEGDGLLDGWVEGFADNDGWDEGRKLVRREGWCECENDGLLVGWYDGVEGARDGFWDGWELGWEDGWYEGDEVGLLVGGALYT
jgi:hypothetical protein